MELTFNIMNPFFYFNTKEGNKFLPSKTISQQFQILYQQNLQNQEQKEQGKQEQEEQFEPSQKIQKINQNNNNNNNNNNFIKNQDYLIQTNFSSNQFILSEQPSLIQRKSYKSEHR